MKIKFKKVLSIPVIIAVIILIGALISCEKEDTNPTTKNPIANLEIINNGDGTYFLDASASEYALEIKWKIYGIIEIPIWEDFEINKTKTITIPDETKNYIVKVYVRNENRENFIVKTITGTPIIAKYHNFENLEEMLENPYIIAAIEANEMEVNEGDSPVDLTGTYGVLTKQNHYVQINGVRKEFQESGYDETYFWWNWRSFRIDFTTEEIMSTFKCGKNDRKVNYEIQGNGSKFTIFFQNKLNPWYTKLDGVVTSDDLWEGLIEYEEVGISIDEGVHIINGEINADNSITLSCLWVRIWEDESTRGTGNWSYCEFTLEPIASAEDVFIDSRDGKTYRIVTIGEQTWFAECLQYKPVSSDGYDDYHFWEVNMENDGTDKLYGTVGEADLNLKISGYAYTFAAATNGEIIKSEQNIANPTQASQANQLGSSVVKFNSRVKEKNIIHFKIKSFSENKNIRGVCPEGWHIPTAREYQELIDYLGGKAVAGKKLKSKLWWFPPFVGNNESGFNMGMCALKWGTTIPDVCIAGTDGYDNMFLTIGESGEMNHAGVSWGDDEAFPSRRLSEFGALSGIAIRCIKDK